MLSFPACVWSCLPLLLTLTSARDVDYCPVASEGSRYELICTGIITSAHYFIEWIKSDTTSNQFNTLTLCSVESSPCDTAAKKEYSVNNTRTGDRFYSLLTFHNVSAEHRNLQFTCQIWEINRDMKVVIKTCKMAVYKPGRDQKSVGTVLRDGRIQLRYSASDSYGISCQFSEKIDGKTTRSNQPMAATNEPYGDQSSYFSSCVVILYPLQKGTYEFDLLVKPNYPTASMGTSYSLGPFKVDRPPRVKIEQVGIATRCNESDTARVRCIADWFGDPPPPEFQFSCSGRSLLMDNPIDKFDNNDYTYKYFAEYRVPMSLPRALMTCTVGYTNGEQIGVLIDTKYLEFRFPPQKPVFHSQGHAILKSYFDINRGENASLECHAPGGHPKVNSTRVVCVGNGNNISSTFNASDMVSFFVHGNNTYQRALCVCYIRHVTDLCDQGREAREVIYLRVENLGNHRDPEKSEGFNKMTPVYYIIMATLVLVFFPIIIGTCVFIHKKGNSLYYYYSTFMRISSPEETISRSSIRAPSNTPRAPAPPPIPERQLPAPPVPPRPTRPSEEQHCPDSVDGSTRYLNGQVWMDDPGTEISPEPAQAATKKPSRKKTKRAEANISATSDDYLLPLRLEISSGDDQSDEVFHENEENYLKMGGVKEKRSDPNFNSLGFAPSLSKRRIPSAPIWRSEDTDLDNTGVKLLDGERIDDPSTPTTHLADDTLAKRLGSGRRSPLRYVKLEGRRDRRRRDTGSESDARQGDSLIQETRHMLDTNSDEESPINVDISTLDIRPPESRHFTEPADSHNSGPSSLTTRAARLENIYVDNSSIY